MARNGLAVASSFFQKRESHKITYRSGQHKTELDLVIVRKQQLWKIKDCKAVAGEHVTKHKPVVFAVRMQKKKQTKTVGRRTIKWWRCKDDVAVEYKERVMVKYEELSEEVCGLEEEWKKYKEAFVGAAEELCGRTSGKGGMSRSSNQGWWTSEVAEAVCEKKEAWKEIEKIKERGNEPDARMIHTYGQKKGAAKRAVDKARTDMEADVYSKLDEDGGKKMIYKMARDRDENSKDVKGGTVMKDRNGKLVTEQEAVLKVWESYFKELLNQERNNNDLELPSYVEGKVELTDITDIEMQTGMKGMKKGRAPGIDEIRVEMVMAVGESGISWTKRLLNTCMRQGKVPEEWRTGLIVPIWKKGDVQDPGKYRGITLLNHIMKPLERILDVRIRKKVEQELGEEQQGFRKGRGTTDGMFTLRQMVEKRLEMQGRMAVGFVDLEKAYDTVPREMVMATVRWMGSEIEVEARMVEAMYERTKGRVVVGSLYCLSW